ncbi:MAG: hypothetical protein PHG95_02845 [Patescibacteria group bacterium]|nr:hypothetical protein [Patescibacteria group bacterium]
MKKFEIKSTFEGMLTSLFNSVIWIVIPIICAYILDWCCAYFGWSKSIVYDDLIVTLMTIGYIIMAIIALCSFWNFFMTAFYGPTNVMVFYMNDQEKITKITDTWFSFVKVRHNKEIICDRVLSVDVYIPTLGSIFNTGTLTITFVSFANADYKKETWEISGVKFPDIMKEKIIGASSAHEGLKISH